MSGFINAGSSESSTGARSYVSAGAGSIGKAPELALALNYLESGRSFSLPLQRAISDQDLAQVVVELQNRRTQSVETFARAGAMGAKDVPSRILATVKAASISRNMTGFNDPVRSATMLGIIANIVKGGGPLYLPLLLGGTKAAVPVKTGDNVLPELSEWMAWLQFDALAEAIEQVYKPGAVVVPIPDAYVDAPSLDFPAAGIAAHNAQLRTDLTRLGITHRVVLVNTSEFLPDDWEAAVSTVAQGIRSRARYDSEVAQRVQDHQRSLVFIRNARRFGLTFEQQVVVAAALAGMPTPGHPLETRVASDIREDVTHATYDYMAVNELIRERDLAGRIVTALSGSREHFRISVHAKNHEPRPILVPEQNRLVTSLALLPMHGLGIRAMVDGMAKFGIGFELVNRWHGATAITHQGRFVWYEPSIDDPRLLKSTAAS